MKNIFQLNDKVAIVTGGYGHIGAAICRGLASMGAIVIVVGPNKFKYDSVFTDQEKDTIKFFEADILNDQSINDCFSFVYNKYKRIDILVNNAVALKGGKPLETSRDAWNYTLNGVLTSMSYCINQVVPLMNPQGGVIINVSSMYGIVSPDFSLYDNYPQYFNSVQYGSAKAGVIQLTRYYANYFAPKGIRVNCISPGPFPSKAVQQDSGFVDLLVKKVPLGRIGEPDDLKGVAIFLASEASSFVTGQNIQIDGGWTIV